MKTSDKGVIIPQQAFDWYDEYAHGDIDRRTFLSRLATLSAMGVTLAGVTAALTPNYAEAEQVSFNDADIKATYELFSSPSGYGEGKGYLVLPKAVVDGASAPAVLVAHENRGLNPYIEDVARRLAKAGFIAFAPDALHSLGGYPGNDDDGRAMQRTLERDKIVADFQAAAQFLHAHPSVTGKVGIVGFCFGGYLANELAATIPDHIQAAVPFYGTPPTSDMSQIKGPIMLHFAELDQRVNGTWPDYQMKLDEMQVPYQAFTYAKVNHGFHNDSTARYHEASAELAWQRTLEFFKQHLS